MKRYVKQDAKGAIEFAPNFVNKEHKLILGYNNEANEKMLLEDGYLIFENTPVPKDGKIYDKKIVVSENKLRYEWIEHIADDEEISAKRNKLFEEISDHLFVKVMRGVSKPEEYIGAIAEIKFENRYNGEKYRTYIDFYNEAAKLWNDCHPQMQVNLK